jgi:hypothetical protein
MILNVNLQKYLIADVFRPLQSGTGSIIMMFPQ